MRAELGTGAMVARDPGYAPLKERLIATSGLAYYRDRDRDLADLISGRLAELKLGDCQAYLDFLADSAGSAELDRLIAQLTIGETYFFRDSRQFDALRDIVLPEILHRQRASKRLRIWSAGCATGAEPYSLAILLATQMASQVEGWQIRILATDINKHFLSEAVRGIFPEWALRSTSSEVRDRCFNPEGKGWKIHPAYQQWIHFAHFNLVENEFPSALDEIGAFDLILCRNVMIYFAPATTRRLIQQFHASLSPHGWFLVGSAEPNLESFNDFQVVNAAGTTLYQKTAAKAAARENGGGPPPPTWAPAPEASQATPLAIPPAGQHAMQAAPRGSRGPDSKASPSGQQLVAPVELNPGVHFYHALLQEQLGNLAEAERLLRQAIYLDRRFVLAHYHLGLSLKKTGRPAEARRSFKNVLHLLDGRTNETNVPHGSGTTVASLAEQSRRHLADLDSL